jgi:hypothetical protein
LFSGVEGYFLFGRDQGSAGIETSQPISQGEDELIIDPGFGASPLSQDSIFVITFLQAHHLDLEFYDAFYKPGAYLKTHRVHMVRWHAKGSKGVVQKQGAGK